MSKIDIEKLHDFSEKIRYSDIKDDLSTNYKITNICDDYGESLYFLTSELLNDYKMHRANYKAYIKDGLNARYLMELRKSAIIPMCKEEYDFYVQHEHLNTIKAIKKFRADYFKYLNPDYEDLEWQYYYMIKYYLRSKAKGICINFEECYIDGGFCKQTNSDMYAEDFVRAHMIGHCTAIDEDAMFKEIIDRHNKSNSSTQK
jgi:hypothetical protein